MAMHPSHVPSPQEVQIRRSHLRPVSSLSNLAAYSSFGSLLATVRDNARLTQEYVAAQLLLYFKEEKVPLLDERMYGNMERDRRCPAFKELEPLYLALTKGCAICFSPEERELYVILARKRIEQKQRRRERISEAQWQELAEKLAQLDHDQRSLLQERQQQDHEEPSKQGQLPAVIRLQPVVVRALRADTSHLLERDGWVEQMLSYLHVSPAKRLVTIQGMTGIGKSSALNLLLKRFARMQNYWPLLYRFSASDDKTASDHLDILLATILADLQIPQTEESNTQPLEERIERACSEIIALSEQGIRVIVLLDDIHAVLDQAGKLSVEWQQFLYTFVQYQHVSAIFLFTREWPGWPGREPVYVVETKLDPLSPEGGVAVWRRFGFEDVSEQLLSQASKKCGGNPRMIEMRAAHLQRPGFVYPWRRYGEVTVRLDRKSEHTQWIERLLEEESVFDPKSDVQTRDLLQQVGSRRLSHQAVHLLEILSLSSIALPFPLLDQVGEQIELAFDELIRCSLIDTTVIESERAAVGPLVRESQLQLLIANRRREEVERRVVHLYGLWLRNLQDFRDDSEKSSLVAELIVFLMKQKQLLQAAELLISYGWLCTLFGHLARLQRFYEEVIQQTTWRTGPESEAGGLLLKYHLAVTAGQKIDPWARDAAYQKIREYVLTDQVILQPHSEIHLAHFLMIPLIRAKRFTEANDFLQGTFDRISTWANISAEVHASFLQSKAYLLSRWGEDEAERGVAGEVKRLRNECVDVLAQGAALWRKCLIDALPLQEHYINFKLARCLNDLAYYLRLLNRLEEAEIAIRECIFLKEERRATLPRSLAVSLGEYAQILSARGKLQDALSYSDRALEEIERLIQNGDASAASDKGMLLVERAHVYLQQARWSEAKQLFEDAIPLLSDFREEFRLDAEKQRAQLQAQLDAPVRYQLDSQWYQHYHSLAAYDDLQWLSQAGPFLEVEQREWDSLFCRRHEEEVKQRLSDMIVQSRQREFSQSLAEHRMPRITYPAIDIDDVRTRLSGFRMLKEQIESREQNAVVRRLYVEKIEEHLQILHLVEATYHQDTNGVKTYNELLYGKPTIAEMTVALREFFHMLQRARGHTEAGELAEHLLKQMRQWHIYPEDFVVREEQKPGNQSPLRRKELYRKFLSPTAVHRFFKEVFSDYQFTEWQIVPSPERDNTSMDLDLCELYLPTRNRFSAVKMCELLAEEIETHVYRSVAGKKSSLALLSSGTKGYLPTDEGLAIRYVQQMRKAQGFGSKAYSLITTLAPGMASGVIFPPFNFTTLYDFLEKAFLTSNLLADRYDIKAEAEESARQEALVRVARTFRAVPDLEAVGVCSLKDRVYLQGHLEVSEKLETVEVERLLVGSIGIGQLEDMAELGILKPAISHRRFALEPDLLDRATAFEDG